MSVHVIGAGLAGLAAAMRLLRAGGRLPGGWQAGALLWLLTRGDPACPPPSTARCSRAMPPPPACSPDPAA